MATYTYHVTIDVSLAFPAKSGGYELMPYGDITVVISSSRRMGDAFVCNAAMNKVLSQFTQHIQGSAGLARSGAKPYLGDCDVYLSS
jgi:hypothetical protein